MYNIEIYLFRNVYYFLDLVYIIEIYLFSAVDYFPDQCTS